MEPLKTAATLDGISTRKDRSLGVRFSTQEMPSSVAGEWIDKNGQFGWLIFVPNEVKEIELPKHDAEAGGKTSSQRLRSVLYRYFMQTQNADLVDFEAWYRLEMNKIIEHYKKKFNGDF